MIHYVEGNIFESKTEYIVNAVNCLGFMGAGLALSFKNKCTPEYFKTYKQACRDKTLIPGVMRYFFDIKLGQWVVDFPTMTNDQHNFHGSLSIVIAGLNALADDINLKSIKSIAIPPLGCGLGGLDWHDVRKAMEDVFQDINCEIYIYEPR